MMAKLKVFAPVLSRGLCDSELQPVERLQRGAFVRCRGLRVQSPGLPVFFLAILKMEW